MVKMKIINSLRLDMQRLTMAFLKVELDFDPLPKDVTAEAKQYIEFVNCFMPNFFFKIRIEPKVQIDNFTDEELHRIAQFILNNNYFVPFNKFLYQAMSGNSPEDNLCTMLDYIDQEGLDVEIVGRYKVGPLVIKPNPIRQTIWSVCPSLRPSP